MKEGMEAFRTIVRPLFLAFEPVADLLARVLRAFQPIVINTNTSPTLVKTDDASVV
jgi:hypothetical protein